MALGGSPGRTLLESAEARRRSGCVPALARIAGCAGLIAAALSCAGAVGIVAALPEGRPARELAPGGYVRGGDVDLHVSRWGPPGGPPVVLVHGSASWGGTWEDTAAALATAGYQVIAPDLPPFGFSERPADERYDAASQAARLAGLLEALELRDVTLIGHSFGGGATGLAVHLARGRIARLVLVDVALGLPPPGSPRPAPSAAMRAAVAAPPVRELVVGATLTNPAFLPTGLRSMVADPADVTPRWIALYRRPLEVAGTTRAVARWAPELLTPTPTPAVEPETWRAIAVPTLIVWGREDQATPLWQAVRLHGLIPGSRLSVLDGVGHIPQVEDPGALNEVILAFLAERR